MRRLHLIALLLPVAGIAACRDIQSVLAPQSADAADIVTLTWVLIIGGGIILAGVITALALAIFGSRRAKALVASNTTVLVAGVVLPAVTLSALLVYGLLLMNVATNPEPIRGAFKVKVEGEQWWWRVIYTREDGQTVASANEITVPAGSPIDFELTTADVIHSFWVPNLAGKVDMIPGRTNRLRFTFDKPGIARGQCAEYCGGAHALMALHVVALPPAEFDAWLAKESQPAAEPKAALLRRGLDIFLAHGCGACHTVRGTSARGRIGPDLTHVGGRRTIAAATLTMSREALARWIVDNQHVKPSNRMPAFRTLGPPELLALSSYLYGLK